MKTRLLIAFFLFSATSLVQAATFTPNKTVKLDFTKTDIEISKVKITYDYFCSYKKKYIDIINGRIGERTVSCGEKKFGLAITNGQIVLPGIEQFEHAKGDDLNRYGLQIKIDYNGTNLIWISAAQKEGIENFFAREYNLTFRKFELKDLEVTYKGLNLLHAPEFNGEKTPVTTFFYIKGGRDSSFVDTDFVRSFKWYLAPFTRINEDDISKMGKISIKPHYHAFINDEELKLIVDVWAKNKEDKFVTAKKFEIPFTQEALSDLKEVELID